MILEVEIKQKEKNLNDLIGNNIKSTPNKKGNEINFDTINPDNDNQFTNIYMTQSKSN